MRACCPPYFRWSSLRSGQAAAEELSHLFPDPLRRGHAAGTKHVASGRDDVLGGTRGGRNVALWGNDELDPQGRRHRADAGEEARGVWRTIQLEAGEIVVMDPLVEECL